MCISFRCPKWYLKILFIAVYPSLNISNINFCYSDRPHVRFFFILENSQGKEPIEISHKGFWNYQSPCNPISFNGFHLLDAINQYLPFPSLLGLESGDEHQQYGKKMRPSPWQRVPSHPWSTRGWSPIANAHFRSCSREEEPRQRSHRVDEYWSGAGPKRRTSAAPFL